MGVFTQHRWHDRIYTVTLDYDFGKGKHEQNTTWLINYLSEISEKETFLNTNNNESFCHSMSLSAFGFVIMA